MEPILRRMKSDANVSGTFEVQVFPENNVAFLRLVMTHDVTLVYEKLSPLKTQGVTGYLRI